MRGREGSVPVGKVGERRGFVACGGAVVLVWAGRRLKEEPQRGGVTH